VTNEETARLAVPELEKLAPMLTSLEAEAGRLPAAEKPVVNVPARGVPAQR
jgi:hypothetical protein